MDNGYNIETCKIIGATSLSLHFCHMRDFFRTSKGGGAWHKWPNGKYAYGDFVLSLIATLDLSRTVSEIRRLAEKRQFSQNHFHLTFSLGVDPFEFLDELFPAKTRVLAYRSVMIS